MQRQGHEDGLYPAAGLEAKGGAPAVTGGGPGQRM